MTEFCCGTLNDVVSLVIDYRGKTPKKLGSNWSAHGYRALSAKNIKTGQIVQPETIRYVDETLYKKWMKDEIKKGDILITSEAPFGQILFWDTDEKIVLSQRIFGLRVKQTFCPAYVYYYMTSTAFQAELDARATGTTVTGLRQPELLKCRIRYPDKKNQQQIANILLKIDNKISLNTKINNNLEQQAQALFKSWFVDFEPFDGTMPENWEERTLTDIPYFTLLKPGIKSFDGEKYYVATADADKDGITNKTTFVTMQNKPSRANMQPLVDSVWFAKMKNSRKNILINKLWAEEINKFILSTGFYGFSCDQNTLYYLWCFIASDAFDELKNNLCNGTTMEAINNDGLGQISLNVPPLETIQNFNRQVAPMFEMIVHNKFENERLAEIRDALLPKLMSGEIDVSKVDISDPSCLDKSLFNYVEG